MQRLIESCENEFAILATRQTDLEATLKMARAAISARGTRPQPKQVKEKEPANV